MISKIICFFLGHKPINKLTEDNHGIYGRCCGRCRVSFLHPTFFKWKRDIPPPNSSEEEIKSWQLFIDEKEQEFREKYG